ncbi:MAG: SixA phosphatase family protein [Longimicrobiales bacterium]
MSDDPARRRFFLLPGAPNIKTVLLLRHAKSSWDQPLLEDFRRPLAPRGRRAAPRVGRYLAREELIPDRVLCSGAARAVETWELVSEALGVAVSTEFREELYHASPRSLMEILRTLPDEVQSILLIGHNPTFETLALRLAGSGNEETLEAMRNKFPTAALAILDFGIERWAELEEGGGVLRVFIRPKELD